MFDKIKPIYKTIQGWKESTGGINNIKNLPQNAIKYIRLLEELIEAEISVVSTGPDRKETIDLSRLTLRAGLPWSAMQIFVRLPHARSIAVEVATSGAGSSLDAVRFAVEDREGALIGCTSIAPGVIAHIAPNLGRRHSRGPAAVRACWAAAGRR